MYDVYQIAIKQDSCKKIVVFSYMLVIINAGKCICRRYFKGNEMNRNYRETPQ